MGTTEAVLSSLISEPGVSEVAQETSAQANVSVQQLQEHRIRATVEPFLQGVGESQDAVPKTFFFGGMNDPLLQLRRPIPLRAERNGGGISVMWDEVAEFGHGDTFSQAVEDFGHTIFELYKTLLADNVVLGSDLVDVRNKLEDYIAVRPK